MERLRIPAFSPLRSRGSRRLGRHLLLELLDCDSSILDDVKRMEELLLAAAREARATVLESFFHRFSPFGITGVVVLSESHLSVHTWPEHAYAAADLFTCGRKVRPWAAVELLVAGVRSRNPRIREVGRGVLLSKASDGPVWCGRSSPTEGT